MLDKEQVKNWDGDPEKPARKPATSAAALDAAAERAGPPANQAFGEATFTGETVKLTPAQEKARKRRGQWIALGLFAFVIIVFWLTMTKMGANILVRDL